MCISYGESQDISTLDMIFTPNNSPARFYQHRTISPMLQDIINSMRYRKLFRLFCQIRRRPQLLTSRTPIGPENGYSLSCRSSSRNLPALPLAGRLYRP